MATTKNAAQALREMIAKAQAATIDGGWYRITNQDTGTTIEILLPEELRFEVRAISTGVNVKIHDDGWVDTVTGGDPRLFSKEQGDLVIAEVDKLRILWKGGLPGETKWGPIIISVTPIGVTHVTNRA